MFSAQISVIIVKNLCFLLALIIKKKFCGMGEGEKITLILEGHIFFFVIFFRAVILLLKNVMINENTIQTLCYHCLNL